MSGLASMNIWDDPARTTERLAGYEATSLLSEYTAAQGHQRPAFYSLQSRKTMCSVDTTPDPTCRL